MIPIEKNISVTDEFGNFHTPTYYKRAKGLVKNGRARYMNENTICLTRPLIDRMNENIIISEGYNMDIYDNNGNNVGSNKANENTNAYKSADLISDDKISLAKHLIEKIANMNPGASHVAVERLSDMADKLLFHNDNKELKLKALELLEKNVPTDSSEFREMLEMILNC